MGGSSVVYSNKYDLKEGGFLEIGVASTKIKRDLKTLGISSALARRVAVVAYEAEMNVVIHAGGGELRIFVEPERIVVEAEDHGPGIANLELAMQEGYSTASDAVRELGFGAGMGLPNIKRNADKLEIDTEVGRGTLLRAVFFMEG
jgi:serine/threonine-protein kinase RsbT